MARRNWVQLRNRDGVQLWFFVLRYQFDAKHQSELTTPSWFLNCCNSFFMLFFLQIVFKPTRESEDCDDQYQIENKEFVRGSCGAVWLNSKPIVFYEVDISSSLFITDPKSWHRWSLLHFSLCRRGPYSPFFIRLSYALVYAYMRACECRWGEKVIGKQQIWISVLSRTANEHLLGCWRWRRGSPFFEKPNSAGIDFDRSRCAHACRLQCILCTSAAHAFVYENTLFCKYMTVSFEAKVSAAHKMYVHSETLAQCDRLYCRDWS